MWFMGDVHIGDLAVIWSMREFVTVCLNTVKADDIESACLVAKYLKGLISRIISVYSMIYVFFCVKLL